ncbi:zinc finger protein CONSTANS-LIKE 16-like [Cynara cardunculus var. scolymus]|uniref:CCT domain-containing protein n=1 Tax=Cynara cardunculus var. scolymus TaxID=59895 RepID=A0A103YA40_CYNCS|nr:zinc finger protein CONSTANS-LIKE 16-like [Cynara cardunculus var. scolymus]KVI05317.1 CCT domain-containing protein [Cynara cardunculus var. scolymus]
MVSSEKKLANAMGGKTARACDNCIRKRARWYCAADDVFLCQFCDALVHSANPLARGHERVRLKLASVKLSSMEILPPTWYQGFTKKSRSPRGKNSNKYGSHRIPNSNETRLSFNSIHLVPEIGSDELINAVNSDDQLPYQVPVSDPFSDVLCFSGDFNEMLVPIQADTITPSGTKHDESEVPFDMNSLNGLVLPSDLELAEFAADVESLLGKSLDEESFNIEALEMVDCRLNVDSERVKVEEDQLQWEAAEIEMMKEPFQLSFDYDSPVTWEEEDDEKVAENRMGMVVQKEDEKCVVGDDGNVNIVDDTVSKNSRKMLKLDYEGIIAAWDDQRSPWATGDRPELDPNDCWPDCMHSDDCGDIGIMMMMGKLTRLDGGREARVSRYREKRRTRLFSKKIRYEVRKLNAEKRPRMKGRFVKRASFAAATASGFPLLST